MEKKGFTACVMCDGREVCEDMGSKLQIGEVRGKEWGGMAKKERKLRDR